MQSFLKSFDSFGSVVGLHFGGWLNKEEGRSPAFRTTIGGIFSILNQTVFWASFFFYASILLDRKNNNIKFQTQSLDWDSIAKN